MNSYRGRHAATRRRRPANSADGARLSTITTMLRRPAVASSLALGILATGAVGMTAQGSVRPDRAAPASSVHALLPVGSESRSAAPLEGERAAYGGLRNTAPPTGPTDLALTGQRDRLARLRAGSQARVRAAAKASRAQARQRLVTRAQTHPRNVTQELMIGAGFAPEQWRCLDSLVMGESSWNYRAVNPTSGAYGLFQSLPAHKMSSVADDWATNPRTQISWGLKYIKDTYGTPCAAWKAWNSRSPHWY